MFKSDFIGTGNMAEFCAEANMLFSALNNIRFIMPSSYDGIEPHVEIKKDSIVFDFGQALIFTLNNVEWNFTGDADIGSYSASVVSGKLVINVEAVIP
jgi:hypothetical protein